MAKPCEHQQPTLRVKAHLPATSWHPHYDRTLEVKQPTEWQAWAKMMLQLLTVLAGGNQRLMVGYWMDALNVLPVELRLALVSGLARGYGLDIQATGEPDTIEIRLVQRYKPLAGPKQTESGLLVPHSGSPDLVLPGDPRYNK